MNLFRNRPTWLIAAAIILATAFATLQTASAQSATRATACDPNTPNDAICVTWTPPTTNTDGSAITKTLSYRVTRALGSGTFTTLTSTAVSQYYDKGLSPGTYTYVVYANCTPSCSEGAGSVPASKAATAPITTPGVPVVILAATIHADGSPPTYRTLTQATLAPSEALVIAPAALKPLFASR